MSSRRFCDICDTQITVNNDLGRCEDCHNYGIDYHATCLTTIYDKKYCSTHKVRAKNRSVIAEYLKKIWDDIGLPGVVNPKTGYVTADFGPLSLRIDSEFDGETKNLNEITIVVEGLAASKMRKFNASLHDHTKVVKDLRQSIVRSLRSSKSAIAIQQKKLRTKLTEIDALVSTLTAKSNEIDLS